MKKQILNLCLSSRLQMGKGLYLLQFAPSGNESIPSAKPGQFVEISVPDSETFLNRPISIFNCNSMSLELLVRDAGAGTHAMATLPIGTIFRIIMPLGHGFSINASKPLLIAGGVGVAPLYMLAAEYNKRGVQPTILFGNRSCPDKNLTERLQSVAKLDICTDDGSCGHHGTVATSPVLDKGDYDIIHCCGPLPMMKAVTVIAAQKNIPCEVSLENKMACGLGACLCCVENTTSGNRCVCTDGPVFNINELSWLQ